MQRLVYNPRIDVFIKADDGVYDISPYVTGFTVNRKVNQVSTASIQFRNPKLMFTEHQTKDKATGEKHIGPIFHPMDPIIITMTRLRDHPIQVFTGYCDTTPYLSLYPGIVSVEASCTLKRLQYTYWDPGLTFVWNWLMSHGWQVDAKRGGTANPIQDKKDSGASSDDGEPDPEANITDSSIGRLLFDFMTEIGGWEEKDIYIEKLPPDIVPLISQMFDIFKNESKQSHQDFISLIHDIIGTASLGGGGSTSPNGGLTHISGDSPPKGTPVTPKQVGVEMLRQGFPKDPKVLATGMYTVEHESGFGSAPGWDTEHDGGVLGYWQIQLSSHPDVTPDCAMTLSCSTKAAHGIWSAAGNCFACQSGPNPWQGGTDDPEIASKYMPLATQICNSY